VHFRPVPAVMRLIRRFLGDFVGKIGGRLTPWKLSSRARMASLRLAQLWPRSEGRR